MGLRQNPRSSNERVWDSVQVDDDCAWGDVVLQNHAADQRQGHRVVQVHFPKVAGALLEEHVVGEVFEEVAKRDQTQLQVVGHLGLEWEALKDHLEAAVASHVPGKHVSHDNVAGHGGSHVEGEFVKGSARTFGALVDFFDVVLVFGDEAQVGNRRVYNLFFESVEGKGRTDRNPADLVELGQVLQVVPLTLLLEVELVQLHRQHDVVDHQGDREESRHAEQVHKYFLQVHIRANI